MNARRVLITASALCLLAFLGVWLAVPLPDTVRIGGIDLLWLGAALIAGVAGLWASRKPENARLRRPLLMFGASGLCWGAGQAVWTYEELVRGVSSPMYAVADIGYLLSVVFQGIAIMCWPRERIRWDLGRLLDVALIGGFAALFGIEFILDPMLAMEMDGVASAYAVAYPLSEIFLFGAVAAVFTLAEWHHRARLELAAFGLLAICIGDAGYSYLGDAYATGGILDPLWTIGLTGIAVAAAARPDWREGRTLVGDRGRLFAPAAALILLALTGVGVHWADGSEVSPAELFALLGLVVLLAVRQGHAQVRLGEHVEEQRHLEQQLQHAQKLEAVGRLAGGVAHDFNNLLTAIDGYSGLALTQLADGHPVRGDIDEVRRATKRASELTRQLLAFSRRQVLAPRVVDLNAVVRDAERMLGRLVGGEVELTRELAKTPALVRADPGQLEQVITNLVLNARDAMPQGGTVEIHTLVALDTVHLCVRDEGTGMDETTRARLFEPFFTTKELGKGTGLGLAMVHGIVTQSSGTISVDSALGRGTRFEVVFPLAVPDEVEPARPENIEVETGSETVLVVEDEPAVRELARRMLELEGYSVVTAASGADAIRVSEELPSIDVLLTDIVMPGLNGRELAATLCSRIPGLRVVLMSGYAEDAEPLDGLLAAGAAFVEKPFTSSKLVSQVRGVLDDAA